MASSDNNNIIIRTVLIMRFSSLADVAMTIPIVYPMCRANEQIRFVFATQGEPATIFANRPANLTVLGIDTDKYKGFFGARKLAANLQHRYGFDAVVDLQDSKYTRRILSRLKGESVTTAVISTPTKKEPEPVNIHERYKRAFKQLLLKTGNDFYNLGDFGDPLTSPLVPAKGDDEKWIGIAPFAEQQCKEYPLEQMRLVIAELSQWPGCHLFLFGSNRHREDLDAIMRRYSNVISMTQFKHSFADELALMSRCDVMLTMDSAYMHLASLVEAPVVSVWGATDPSCGYMGWHQALRDTVQLELDCRPCSADGSRKCIYGDCHCMRDISPELIINKVKKVLERND